MLDLQTIRTQYPRAWSMMLNSFRLDEFCTVDDEGNIDNVTVYRGGQIQHLRRELYDFFDENEIFVSVEMYGEIDPPSHYARKHGFGACVLDKYNKPQTPYESYAPHPHQSRNRRLHQGFQSARNPP